MRCKDCGEKGITDCRAHDAVCEGPPPSRAALRAEIDSLRRLAHEDAGKLATLGATVDRLTGQVSDCLGYIDAVLADRDQYEREADEARASLDGALRERDEAREVRDAAVDEAITLRAELARLTEACGTWMIGRTDPADAAAPSSETRTEHIYIVHELTEGGESRGPWICEQANVGTVPQMRRAR